MNALAGHGGSWIPPAAAADILRVFLLARYGGVWCDATILCRKPLMEWLPAAAPRGVFAYAPEKCDQQEPIPVMSSFLAASPGHPIFVRWLDAIRAHWTTPSPRRPDLGYFWVHTLFGDLVQRDQVARDEWAAVPRRSGEYGVPGPHRWMPYETRLTQPPSESDKELVEGGDGEPLYKMTIHDVKFDRAGGPLLLDRSSQPLPGANAEDSLFEFLLHHTLQQAQEHLDSTGVPYEANPLEFNGDLALASASAYRLRIAEQPWMPH